MYKCAFLLLFLSSNVFAQNIIPKADQEKHNTKGKKDIIDVGKSVFHIKKSKVQEDKEKQIYFSFFPGGASGSGGQGKALLTSTTAATYLASPKTTNISSMTFAPYFNFKGRFGLPLRSSIWFPENKWTIQGDIRLLVYPQYTWGLGSQNASAERSLIDYRYIRFYQNVLKRVKPYLYAGLGYELDYFTHIKSDEPTIDLTQFTGYQYGTNGTSFASGICLNLFYDSRTNSINPLPSAYANIKYRFNPSFLGNEHAWHSLYFDFRKYVSLNKQPHQQRQNTIAFWSYFWTAMSAKTPYLNLPSTGWDPYNRSARGIDQNRYRGPSLLYFETEYRRDITADGLLGFVVFANVNTVSGSGTFFQSWHPAMGTGIRIKFNKKSATNIAIDFGFSKGYKGFKLGLGETF